MSIIKNIFQNFRKPKNSFMGRCIVKMMNQGHNRISLWCIDNFVKLSGGETVLDIGCGGGQNVANFIKRTHVEKPRDFDPFGHAGFAHLWLQYD